jgi:hypothetical protein
MRNFIASLTFLVLAGAANAQGTRLLSKDDYADRLRGMWLGQTIANWTGLRTEGLRQAPPFYTDADWGQSPDGIGINFVLNQNPWLADDDTDVEYVYLDLLTRTPSPLFSGAEIAEAWRDSINRFIWVSNARARSLMDRGVVPPMTGMPHANDQCLMIDAQLTTELFGALAPGMPEEALRLADLPIRTTASSYAAHASQFYVVLYSLATQCPTTLTPAQKVRWLYDQARLWIPNTSKTADIADFVLADFLANPDPENWERTRDLVAQRYQSQAIANGFRYRAWYESSVNFAGGCIALLYGRGDYRRTTQIATLVGWDSDNATATLGGLYGLMNGYQAVCANFPNQAFSDRFDIYRTRDALPDYLPADAAAQDTFTLMSQRMIPHVERVIRDSGGLTSASRGLWLLRPPLPAAADRRAFIPSWRDQARSANIAVRAAGGTVNVAANVVGTPPSGFGVGAPAVFANALEYDDAGREMDEFQRNFFTTMNAAAPAGRASFSVTYSRTTQVHTVRFVEGDHYNQMTPVVARGGYFVPGSIVIEVRVNGLWIPIPGGLSVSPAPDPAVPFEVLDFVLNTPVDATGVRITGTVGGTDAFVTIAELDALAAPAAVPSGPSFGVLPGVVDADAVYRQNQSPRDVDNNGSISPADLEYLEWAARWPELDAAGERR